MPGPPAGIIDPPPVGNDISNGVDADDNMFVSATGWIEIQFDEIIFANRCCAGVD